MQTGVANAMMLNGLSGIGGENWYATSTRLRRNAGAVFAAFCSGSGSADGKLPTPYCVHWVCIVVEPGLRTPTEDEQTWTPVLLVDGEYTEPHRSWKARSLTDVVTVLAGQAVVGGPELGNGADAGVAFPMTE